VRLTKYIASCGVASRRHAERLVTSGRVQVAGKTVLDPAFDVDDQMEVHVEGRAIGPERREYYVLNKPVGVVSTAHDPEGREKVTDLVPSAARLYPVGRLDAGTSGLILLTNDGELANRLTHPSFEVEKSYRARVRGTLAEPALERLRAGVVLDDGHTTAPATVRVLGRGDGDTELEFTVHEGRKRQVRRMCEAIGNPVVALERTRLGSLELGTLGPGAWRPLEPEEIEHLRRSGRKRRTR
jgi:23S rRNA pseudouridine2605 synthase